MIYRTLHTYILRELLRVFLLTASVLTTLMAFGGTFRPLTKQGIDVRELLVIVVNMMPAMMAYAIPIAALFAAVLVYWRMSTDNELTACRAGGVSFTSIVLPAFVLGLAVASIDLVFVNYVVPRFLQSTERAVRQDLGSLIVSQIGRQEKFQVEGLPLVVTANSAELRPSDDPNMSVVVLEGMAASKIEPHGKPSYMAIAQEAIIEIRNLPKEDAAEVSFRVKNSSGFDPTNGYKKVSVTLDWTKLTGKPYRMSSILRTKPKFLNLKDLRELSLDPYAFPDVAKVFDRIKAAYDYEQISQNVQAQWQKNGRQLVFKQQGGQPGQFALTAARATLDPTSAPEESLTFSGAAAGVPGGVRIEESSNSKLLTTYTSDAADLVLSTDPLLGQGITVSLQLRGHVKLENVALQLPPKEQNALMLSQLALDAGFMDVSPAGDKAALAAQARQSPREPLRKLGDAVQKSIDELNQNIDSELHSRGSFSLSCLTLVLFGAALGILLRGKNPLAVFVVGFVPAVVLVLLITAGRQLTEGDAHNVTTGISLIWAGNAVLLLLVAGVYLKLLRR